MRWMPIPEDAIIRLRKELPKQGLDAGAETIAAHLARCKPGESGRPVADGTEISILNIVDDHCRLCMGSDARRHNPADSRQVRHPALDAAHPQLPPIPARQPAVSTIWRILSREASSAASA
jgi:hypothetical protein